MPVLDNMETKKIKGSNFGFSAQKIDSLGATEYTLVTLVVDTSGSVDGFAKPIEDMVKTVVKACRKDKRADNLLLRTVFFNSAVSEVHGFKQLADCNEDDYNGTVHPGGMTALFDATFSAVKAMTDYGKDLTKQDFSVNAALFVITDGAENASTSTGQMVRKAIEEAKTGEAVESIMPVLVGVNTDATSGLNQYLQAFQTEAGFQQYVPIDKADEKSLAKLANFISKSISSQSQALGTGGNSKNLTF